MLTFMVNYYEGGFGNREDNGSLIYKQDIIDFDMVGLYLHKSKAMKLFYPSFGRYCMDGKERSYSNTQLKLIGQTMLNFSRFI